MRKIKCLLKLVAFSLSVVLVMQILPLSTLATELNNRDFLEQAAKENSEEYIPDIVEEVEELRGEYTKHFRREDGSYVAAVYSEPVHYQKDGEWKNINNELKVNNNTVQTNNLSSAKYTVTETSTPLSFPENINTGKITISKNGNIISFGAKGSARIASAATLSSSNELVSASVASVQSETLTVDETQAKLIADTGTSAITYSNAFEGASLEYEVSSSIVKESIVVTERSDSYRYEFSIDFGSFIPVYDELTGGIYVYETASAEPVMAITPPYMFDADGETSDAVTMQLIQNADDYTLIIQADSDWINSIFRKFPVVIDPTFDLDIAKSDVDDIHVNQNKPNRSYKLDYQLEVGRNNNNLFRTYIKYILPELPDCSVITDANLTLVQNWSRSFDATDVYLNVYQCESSWDFDSITWNTQPIQDLSAATIVDYTNFVGGMSAEYNLNITKIVKDWYENGENYGLMLALSDESVEEKTSFYATRNIVSKYPSLTVSYVNNTGVEDYWDYETISFGRSGTAYVNLYNGELSYVHGYVSTGGLRAPASLSHIYNQSERNASGTFNEMSFGKGFRMNICEQIEATDDSSYPYKYIDADGTVHFFEESGSTNQYTYEFDPSVVLTKHSTGYTMSFTDGSAKHFSTDGYWAGESDSNTNSVSVYKPSKKIEAVYDGANSALDLVYNSDNTLNSIGDPAGRATNYIYNSSGMLTAITYPDSTSTQYAYNANSLLESVISPDGSKMVINYKEVGETAKRYRVSKISVYGTGNAFYDYVEFCYNTNETVVKNSLEDNVRFAFDSTGKTVSCIKNGKTILTSGYVGIRENEDGTVNKIGANNVSYSSNSFTPTENLERRNSSAFYKVNVPDYSSLASDYRGGHRVCVEADSAYDSSYIYKHTLPHDVGKTYTYTVYANIVDTLSSGTVYMKADVLNSADEIIKTVKTEEIVTTDNNWKRLSLTMTIPEGTEEVVISYGIFNGVGVAYLKDFAYDESEAFGHLNLLSNSAFENKSSLMPAYGWNGEYYGVAYVTNPVDSSKAFRIDGDPTTERSFYQSVSVEGKAGDTVIFGGSAQALCSASGNDGTRFFGIKITLLNGASIAGSGQAVFSEDAYDTMQTVMSSAIAKQDYDTVKYEICYNYEVNSAIFDNLFLYRDSFATDYTYDDQGRLTTVSDDNGNQTTIDYNTSNDITGITVSANGQVLEYADYSYDSKHNMLSASGSDGITTSYTYNTYGLPTSVTVSDDAGLSSTTSYIYNYNSNHVSKITDPSGAVTEYVYDNGETCSKCLLTSVIDPNGNKTAYTYDPNNDSLLSVSAPAEESEPSSTEFTYNSQQLLSGISNLDVDYSMTYDAFSRSTSTQIEGNTVITNAYNEKHLLESSSFANGDTAEYTYNDDRQLSGEKYNGVLTYSYAYTANGRLGKTTDYENDVVWEYQYDLAGRLRQIYGSNKISVDYLYNDKNQLEKFIVAENNVDLLNTAYTYDDENRPASVTIGSMANSPVQTYAYDSFGRTQSISSAYNGTNKVVNNYTYLTNGTNQTGRVGSVDYVKTTADGSTNILPTLSYTYDANGNITHIYENGVQKVKYYYDGLNRLIREDNSYLDKTVIYNYDKSGDILDKTEYALTDSESLGTVTKYSAYDYGDSRFPNGLTAYNNSTVTYDANGNPLTYRGYTMNWEKGRQLSELSGNGIAMSFKYDNNGIRTKKTVNNTDTDYFYVGDTLVSQKTGDEVINFAYTAGGAPYGFTYNGTSYFYLLNLQGDVIGIYDSNGNIVVNYVYDSWGKLVSITGSLASTIGVKNPLRYRGYYYDTETGLYYLQSRYYDPDTCRFINADSLLVAGDYLQGVNMFSYCYNNPVVYSDYTGCAPDYFSYIMGLIGPFLEIFTPIINRLSPILAKGYGGTSYSLFEIDHLLWKAISAAGYDMIGDYYITVGQFSSGVIRVTAIFTDTQLHTGDSEVGNYTVEMYFGNSAEWAAENKRYNKETAFEGLVGALASTFVSLYVPPLGGLMTLIGIGILFVPDSYRALIDNIIEKSAGKESKIYGAVLFIRNNDNGNYVYKYSG